MKININEMIIYKGGDPDFKFGIASAYINHENGRGTRSNKNPLIVRYISEEKKYLVIDGYHRIVKGLLEGKREFDCKVDWNGKYSNWWVPPKEKRFILENYLGDKNE
jgi:hypothetical protein